MRSLFFKLRKHIAKNYGIEINKAQASIINEAINLEKEAIFIAIPKTGTTTVRKQLTQKGKAIVNDPHLDIIQIKQLLYIHCLKEALGKNQTFPSSTTTNNKVVELNRNALFEKLFKFSAVRNPWARAVSLYYRNEGLKYKNKFSFEEFIKNHKYASDTCTHPTTHQNQIDWLCDINGTLVMDYIYKIENFSKAIDDIYELSKGKIKLFDIKENTNSSSKSKNYRTMYNEITKNIIASRFEKDIDYFKYTF